MAFNMLPTGMSFQRLGQFPLDSSSVYKTLAEAMDYVQNNPTAYPGQIIYVADARTEEEIVNNVEAYESLFMITAERNVKLVVSEDDLDMDEMVQEVEKEVEQLQENLDKAVEAIGTAMNEKAQADEEKHAEMEQAMADMKAEMENKHAEMEAAAKAKHEEMEAQRKADHEAMEKAAQEKHAEMEQAAANFRAEMEQKHEEIKAEADAEHTKTDERLDILETLNLENKPYIDKNGMLVLCGNPAVVRPNADNNVEVAFRFFNDEVDKFVFSPEEFAKTRICMGYGAEGVGTKRNIAETTLELYDLDKVFIIDGGSQVTGEIGTVNIIAENVNYIDGIQGARAMNGGEKNIVHNFNVKVNNVKLIDTLYGGGNGYSVVWNSNVEVNGNTEINYLSAGGSNGYMKKGRVVLNGGHAKVMQGVNRGIVDRAELIVNGGVVDNFYVAGEVGNTSGILNEGYVELNNGVVKNFHEGEGFKKATGHVLDCVVESGDISMLEQFAHMFFGGDANFAPVANEEEIKALAGKQRVNEKEATFVVPAGSQRVTVAVPNDVVVEEIQYMGQGCVDYKDMFEESVIENFNVMTYIFAIPCSAKMTFKIVLG